MRVLLDTNVVLDFLLDREPFADAAAALWEAGRNGQIENYVSALTPVNVFYIARKLKGVTDGHLDAIVTRDPTDYAKATLPVFSPPDLLTQLSLSRGSDVSG